MSWFTAVPSGVQMAMLVVTASTTQKTKGLAPRACAMGTAMGARKAKVPEFCRKVVRKPPSTTKAIMNTMGVAFSPSRLMRPLASSSPAPVAVSAVPMTLMVPTSTRVSQGRLARDFFTGMTLKTKSSAVPIMGMLPMSRYCLKGSKPLRTKATRQPSITAAAK